MRRTQAWALVTVLALTSMYAGAAVSKGSEVPPFRVVDIQGNEVSLESLVAANPELVILFFFTTDTGEEIANKLHELYQAQGKEKLQVVGFALKEDEPALKAFAERMGIEYYIVQDRPEVAAERKFGPFQSLPITFIATPDKKILKVLEGGGATKARLLSYIAETYLMKNRPEEAEKVAEVAAKAGEDKAREVKAYAQVEQGKLDEAEKEFAQIDSKTGLAAVALEKGEYARAQALAEEAGDDPFAGAVKGQALLHQGKAEEAARAFEEASARPLDDWQMNEAIRGQGRALQEQGNVDGAVTKYRQALELNPWDVTALSNEGEVWRQQGDLEKAAAALRQAQQVSGGDAVAAMMLRQIEQQMENANNTQRRELIRKQIADLQERAKELAAAGRDKPADDWTSRPLVVAFLPSENKDVFFERAGMDVALQREIEARLQAHDRIQVVEREVLDALLQELNLGTSDMADPDTQLRLGRVLSAQLLGLTDFTQTGPEKTLYLRMVDTETTSIDTQVSRPLAESAALDETVNAVVDELVTKVLASRKLQGLIADVPSPDEVYINLGRAHGVTPGTRFAVLQDGGAIEVGGKTLGRRQMPVGTLEVTEVEDQLSLCKVVDKKDGVEFAPEMKVKEVAGGG